MRLFLITIEECPTKGREAQGPSGFEVVKEASEVLKRLPDLPIIMDKANSVMTLIAEGKFNPNTLAYHSLREEELKLKLMRNKILGGVLVLVIIVLLVF